MRARVKYKTLNIVTNAEIERNEVYEGKNEKDILKKVMLINYVVNNIVEIKPITI